METKLEHTIVYHYTSLELFYKLLHTVLKTGDDEKHFEFHATSALFMNDVIELQHGYNILLQLLEFFESKNSIEENIKLSNVREQLFSPGKSRDYVSWFVQDNTIKMDAVPYIVSLSYDSCSIPMWNMYGDKGEGVCLGFIENDIKRDDVLSFPVIYDFNNQIDEYKDLFVKLIQDEYDNYINRLKNQTNIIEEKMSSLRVLSTLLTPFFKKPCFEFEHEYRLVKNCSAKDTFYKERNNSLQILYTIIKIPFNALNKVIIGPCSDYNKLLNIIHAELKYCDPQHFVEIEQSELPLRKF